MSPISRERYRWVVARSAGVIAGRLLASVCHGRVVGASRTGYLLPARSVTVDGVFLYRKFLAISYRP